MSKTTSYNSKIDLIDMNIDEWATLSDEEQKAKLEGVFTGKEGKEAQEIIDGMVEDVAAEQEKIKDLKKDLKKLLTKDSLSDSERAKAEAWLEQLDSIAEELGDYLSTADTLAQSEQDHHIDASNGQNQSVSNLELDGKTYEYTMGGAANPFGDDSENEEGVDVSKQSVFINTPPDQHWELVSADKKEGNYTFKVTDKDGNHCYVTFNNAADVNFFFSSGISEQDLEAMKDKWPSNLLKHCYWGSGSEGTSFFDELF